ncbi:hypothetical protein JG687_00000129 [Phytophthora cactorum]|uniref:Uncharacterized protein n=1 Tax=Phytophthora cactorum TaxID=29920 RepID=A0A8T1V4G0_9STRA|nr:hypothetical protein JG687_00000129 [Phytophthora cactorum]
MSDVELGFCKEGLTLNYFSVPINCGQTFNGDKMLVRLRGWGDADVLTLLTLFRRHLLYYVYASDSQFAEVMRAELPNKAASEILEMVRALMDQFGLTLSTKNFRTDVIVINGHEIYVYEHIYESIRQLPENRAGGVWLPDELSRFLQKAKQYRDRFTDSEEKYFKQVQVWGKSIAETKSKFYALREIFMREKRRMRQDTWNGDADLDDDGLDNQSVGSSDNAWSGSSNFSDTKDSHHHSKSNAPLGNNLLAGQPASKKPSKRGKDEQYGKNFKLAKKRRLDEKTSASTKDDYEDEDRDDEGYDEGDDDDESEDAGDEPSADVDSLSSDGELEETPHPLQSILDSLDAHMVELQEKQRVLIEQKETCQWRQHQYVDRQYGVQTNAQSFSSQW